MSTDIIVTGLVLSASGTAVMLLKDLPRKLWNFIKHKTLFVVTINEKDELFHAIGYWLSINHHNKFKDVEAGYSIDKSEQPKFKVLKTRPRDSVFFIRWKGKLIWFHAAQEKLQHAQSAEHLFSVRFHIWGYRKKKHILSLLEHVTEIHNAKNGDEKIEIKILNENWWELFDKKDVKPLDKIILKPSLKQFLIDDLKKFSQNEDWYVSNNIPYKRNYLFYGPPGTGKSSTALAIARFLKKSLCVMSPSAIRSDIQLNLAFRNLSDNTILLIEDIDSCFIQRDNQKDSHFSFSSLLNCLDGSMSKHGLIVIMSTNHLEKLDEALLRPGRTDVKLEIPAAATPEIESYLRQFYVDDSISLKDKPLSIPMSRVQETCIRNDNNHEDAMIELLAI